MSKNHQQQQQRPGNLIKCKNCNSTSNNNNNNNNNDNNSNNSVSGSSSNSRQAQNSSFLASTSSLLSDNATNVDQTNMAELEDSFLSSFNSNNNNNGVNANVQVNANQKNFSAGSNSFEHLTRATLFNKNSSIIERLRSLCLNESLADVYFLVRQEKDTADDGVSEAVNLAKAHHSDKSSTSLSSYSSLSSSSDNKQPQASFGDNNYEKIPAHKLILSIGSQVFMAMFYGSGSQMETKDEIVLPDVDSDSFKIMLKYLYTDELQIEPDSVMSTLYAAKKYAVVNLEKECVDFLKCNLRADNAFMLLEQALMFDETALTELCLNLIDKNTSEAFSSDCFLDIGVQTLVMVLKRDSLGIREFNLLKYLLKWAQAKCSKKLNVPVSRENMTNVLKDVVKYVRFPLMNREEFAVLMNDYDSRVIDDQSIIDLFVNLTLVSGVESNMLASKANYTARKLPYNDTPRCCLGGKEEVINRFGQVESRWGYSGTSDRVKFSVNRRIFVMGFGLYGSIYGKCEYTVLIQLIHYDSCTTCAQNSTSFICDGSNSTFKVFFKEPVEIYAETDYIASATLKGPDSYYGTKGTRKVTHESQTEGKVTFNFQYASGNNNGTSVEDGQIPEIIFFYSPS